MMMIFDIMDYGHDDGILKTVELFCRFGREKYENSYVTLLKFQFLMRFEKNQLYVYI